MLIVLFAVQCANKGISSKSSVHMTEGETLARQYCVSCHQFASPDLLDKNTWNQFVLVRMASFLGIYTDNVRYYDEMPSQWIEPGNGGDRIREANIYPKKPLISIEEWEKIKAYYLDNAPEKLSPNSDKLDITVGIPSFKSKPFDNSKSIIPLIQSINYHSESKEIIAAQYKEDFFIYDSKGNQKKRIRKKGHFVDVKQVGDFIYALDMGTRIASDDPKGKLLQLNEWSDLENGKEDVLFRKLMRPVHFDVADFNNDGEHDFVIAEYGSNLGALNLYLSNPRGSTKVTLFEVDGSIRSEILDLDGDGDLDIVALMANADEGIDEYINDGKGNFTKTRILRFSPCNGSTYFEKVDWDNDGELDILYSNGDNGDYTPVNKPYHGIHLFSKNNGTYQEEFFIPMNGVYQAEAVDFDMDGDMDVVAVSFHPDFRGDAKESFQVFINNGKNEFKAFTIPQYEQSRWMRFFVEDIDQDGDPDILLSAMNIKTPDVPQKNVDLWRLSDKAMVLIENQIK